jgi:dynein heavy chain
VEDCKKKLVRAHKLIGGLGGERVRWEQMVVDLKKSANTVLGDTLLAAAYPFYIEICK